MLIQTKNRRVATTGFLWQRKEFLQSDGLPPKLNLLFVEPTPVVSGDKKNLTDQGRNERQQRKLEISTINDGPLLRNFIYWIGWWLQQKFSSPLPEIVTKERTIISEPVCIIVYILWYNHYIRTIFLYQKWSWNAWGYANLIWINPPGHIWPPFRRHRQVAWMYATSLPHIDRLATVSSPSQGQEIHR